jgi:hypothetical protein
MAKNFSEATLKAQKSILAIVDKSFLRQLGNKFREIIYRRVKSGYGVSDMGSKDPQQERLKALSDKYVDFRKGNFAYKKKRKGKKVTVNKGAPKLGDFGSPGKSNLTLTGQMLDSIQIKLQPYGVLLYFPDTKHRYSKRITVRELAQYVQEQGRPFFRLTRGERRILLNLVKQEVRSKLRR